MTGKHTHIVISGCQEIQEKIPSDPLEAELLMMAEAVAGGGDSDSDSARSDAEPFRPVASEFPSCRFSYQ